VEYAIKGKPSVLGFCSGAVAGLVVITPAAGFVDASAAMVIGILAGVVPFLACWKLKGWLGYDDALDTFGVHAVGGTLGAFVTGIFAKIDVNANLATNLKSIVGRSLWLHQLGAMALTIVLAVGMTLVIAYVVKAVVGLRPTEDVEYAGLDVAEHGEEGYHSTAAPAL
ncbi:MAG TPA: ammonia channel protein, partial [Anaeromyxobacteraceae bacterium]|nr:ammonia channel protein [Anaeromyxobacteraceae bacterium]